MTKESAAKQPDAVVPHAAVPEEDKKRAAERRRLQEALEDDEVDEALRSLHAQKQTKSND